LSEIDHALILCILGQVRSFKEGNQIFMGFNGAFSSIMERKEDKYIFWEYIYELWTLQRKIPSLVSLIAPMVFNDSFGVENYI